MAYREVSMEEIREVIRLWRAGMGRKPIAALVGLDPKTVRSYLAAAQACGIEREGPEPSEVEWAALMGALQPSRQRERGEAWQRCLEHRARIESGLRSGLKLTRIHALLKRDRVEVPYSTLHRFAREELEFGQQAATIPVLDGEPGQELQIDTGWMTTLEPDERGRSRRFRAWIFTPSLSRHRFVHPCFAETTASAIEACEAAWRFYGGVFRVLIPDNTKAIVQEANPLQARIVREFREYAQVRGFVIDPARVRSPRDKGRVERTVSYVRDSCFAGERLADLEQARERACAWCEREAGQRLHARTQRRPREHFLAEEQGCLLPLPSASYDVPLHCDPKVERDQHAQVAKGLYSLPRRYVGKRLHARADAHLVRFYDGLELVKTHPRVAAGQRSTDPVDFPEAQRALAQRDVGSLVRRADDYGPAIGRMTRAILDVPLPWTRMRRVYALFSLVKKYGPERVEGVCDAALAVEMHDVQRLARMLAHPLAGEPIRTATVIPIARYLRPIGHYALSLVPKEGGDEH